MAFLGSKESRKMALFFYHFSVRSPNGMFGSALHQVPKEFGGDLEILKMEKTRSVVSTRVPNWCVDSNGRLLLSASMAFFDEISTYCGTVAWDRLHRPGLSLQLMARRMRPIDIGAGDTIFFETRLQKIGKTIGFVDIIVSNKDGQEIIFGQHIKFMPMGLFFDVFLSPWVRPFSLPLGMSYYNRYPMHSPPPASSIDDIFPFEGLNFDGHTSNETLVVTPKYGNPIGGFHGGAAVMTASHSASRAIENFSPNNKEPTMIKTTLISSIRVKQNRKVSIDTVASPESMCGPSFWRTRTIINDQSKPAIDCSINWSQN